MLCWFPVLLRLAIAGPALQPQPLHQVTVHPPFQRTSEDFRMVDQPQPKVIEVLIFFSSNFRIYPEIYPLENWIFMETPMISDFADHIHGLPVFFSRRLLTRILRRLLTHGTGRKKNNRLSILTQRIFGYWYFMACSGNMYTMYNKKKDSPRIRTLQIWCCWTIHHHPKNDHHPTCWV